MEEPQPTQALAIAPRPMGLGYLRELGRIFAASKYFPSTSAEQAMAKIKAGEELGIPPVAAMQAIYFFDGKITLSATLMATLIQKSGRFAYRVRRKDAQACEIEFFEHGTSVGVETFTLDEARTAGLLNKDNWRKYPKAMLFNRAMSNGAKTYCPAVFAGNMVYTPDEITPDRTVNPDTGEIVDGDAHEVNDSPPPATADQKQDMQAWFRDHKMRGPDADKWLANCDFPPVSQMTQLDATNALNVMWRQDNPTPVEEIFASGPASDVAPEPTEAVVPAA